MALLYVDTSALMKHYIPEAGSERVDELLSQTTAAVSSIVRVEVASALARRTREGRLTVEQREFVYATFLTEFSSFIIIEADEAILMQAAHLVRTTPGDVPLRSLDAIHLASALQIFDDYAPEHGNDLAFVTADRQLRRAAEHAELRTIDPEMPDAHGGC